MNGNCRLSLPLLRDLTAEPTRPDDPALTDQLQDATLPPASRASARIEEYSTELLGAENLAFLRTVLNEKGISAPSHKDLLNAAATFAAGDAQREAISEFIKLYVEILDFEGKLDLPRTYHSNNEGTIHSVTTEPHGESVYLISRSLEQMIEDIRCHTLALAQLKEDIAVERISRFGATGLVPHHAELDPVSEKVGDEAGRDIPGPSGRHHSSGKLTFKLGVISLRFLGQLIEAAKENGGLALSTLAALMRSTGDGRKEAARPGQTWLKHFSSRFPGISSFFDLSILGRAESAASQALGLLCPRMERSRYAQTGSPNGSSADGEFSLATIKDALFRFTLDLGDIRAFFASHKHINGNLPSFFAKEAQVVTDREGKIERLDSFLSRSETGRQLSGAFYQTRNPPSTFSENLPTVTIPIIPLLTTSLPVPPGRFISGLEYLNAKGERIEQPESNTIRACVAGGALVNAPLEARIVRFTVASPSPYDKTPSPHCPTPLTADEYRRFKSLLPALDFELSNESRLMYKAINQFHQPATRFNLANAYEAGRGWSYSMNGGIIEFQRKAGTAFLESVYNMRAGICDSMSTIGAHIFGSALGLSGLVLSGPVQTKGNFDLRVGHSITCSMQPSSIAYSDLTKLAVEDGLSASRVPSGAHRMLRDVLNDKQSTRSEIAEVYGDIGDLMRGKTPDRFIPHSGEPLTPRALLQDYLYSLGEKERESPLSSDELLQITGWDRWSLSKDLERTSYIKLAFQLDEILSRTLQSGSGSELLWFTDQKLAQATFSPLECAVDTIIEREHVSRTGAEQLKRFLKAEATEALCSVIKSGELSETEIRSLPLLAKKLPFFCHLAIAEAIHGSHRDEKAAKECTAGLLMQFAEHFERSGDSSNRKMALEFVPRLTQLTRELLMDGTAAERKQLASYLKPLLSGINRFESADLMRTSPATEIKAFGNLADLFGAVYQAGREFAPKSLIATLHDEYYSRQGFEHGIRFVPESFRRALLGDDVSAAKQVLEKSLADTFYDKEISLASHLWVLRLCEGAVPDLDFSAHAARLDSAIAARTREYIKKHIGSSSDYLPKYAVNWPSDNTPASTILANDDYSSSGGQGIHFLQRLVDFKALTEKRAIEIWPSSDEKKHIETFLQKVEIVSGRLKIEGNYESAWPLTSMPLFFDAIGYNPDFPQQSRVIRQTIEWVERQKPIEVHPYEKPLLKIIELLGEVPPKLQLTSERQSSTVTALCNLAQREISPQKLFEAIHTVAPRLIRPAEEERLPAHQAALEKLALSLRDSKDAPSSLQALIQFEPFTRRTSPLGISSIEGIAEAVTLLDICNQFSVSLKGVIRMSSDTKFAQVDTLMKDDGTSPANQVWTHHFPTPEPSYYSENRISTAIDRIQKLFRSSTISVRTKLRSPMLAWTLVDDGRVHVPGGSGTPDDSRRYQPGDSVRNIDWNRSFRNGRNELIVKVRKEQEERHLTFIADLSVLAVEFGKLHSILEEDKKKHTETPALTLARTAPALTTLIHETLVASENRLKVDLLLTHHEVVRRENNCEKLLLGKDKAAQAFHHRLDALASRASNLKGEEKKIFGEDQFHPGSPLSRHEIPLRRNSLVHFLPAAPYVGECVALAPALKRQGHQFGLGTLAGLEKKKT